MDVWAGSSSTNPSATHVYGASGVYRASVTVTDSVGGTVTQNLSIQVMPVPAGAPERWFGLTEVQWGTWASVSGLSWQRSPRWSSSSATAVGHPDPIAAAAVGQPGWGDEEAPVLPPPVRSVGTTGANRASPPSVRDATSRPGGSAALRADHRDPAAFHGSGHVVQDGTATILARRQSVHPSRDSF